MGKRCPQKVRYASIVDALSALIGMNRRLAHTGRQLPHRLYKCSYCHHWHLTSQERHAVRAAVVDARAREILGLR